MCKSSERLRALKIVDDSNAERILHTVKSNTKGDHSKQKTSEEGTDGPKSEAEIHKWCDEVFARCSARGLKYQLSDLVLQVTVKWAGLGGMAMPFLYLSNVCPALKFVFHAFCDYNSVCLQLLKTYNVLHLFSDLLLGCKPSFMTTLRVKQGELRSILASTPKGNKRSRAKKRLVKEFKEFCIAMIDEFEAVEMQPCLRHGCECMATPNVIPEDHAWVECVSPSCVHWSSQGSRTGWLGHENLVLILWAMAARFKCPDLTFLECTPQLDLAFLTMLSGGRLIWHCAYLGPYNVGLPVVGERVWATAAGAGGKLMFRENPYADELLVSCVYRKVLISPAVFLCASRSEVEKYLDEVNSTRDKIQPHPRGKRYRAEDYLGTSYQCRLDMHREAAAKLRLRDPSLLNTEFFYDVSQNVTWSRRPDGLLPRPLCSSTVWCERLNRPICPWELLVAQGDFVFAKS